MLAFQIQDVCIPILSSVPASPRIHHGGDLSGTFCRSRGPLTCLWQYSKPLGVPHRLPYKRIVRQKTSKLDLKYVFFPPFLLYPSLLPHLVLPWCFAKMLALCSRACVVYFRPTMAHTFLRCTKLRGFSVTQCPLHCISCSAGATTTTQITRDSSPVAQGMSTVCFYLTLESAHAHQFCRSVAWLGVV